MSGPWYGICPTCGTRRVRQGECGVCAIAVSVISDGPEDQLADQLSYAGIEFVRQYKPYPSRRFRVDFYIAEAQLIVEVDGGIHAYRPSHTSVKGILRDIEKTNLATVNGYRLLRFTGQQVEDGEALTVIEQVIGRAA